MSSAGQMNMLQGLNCGTNSPLKTSKNADAAVWAVNAVILVRCMMESPVGLVFRTGARTPPLRKVTFYQRSVSRDKLFASDDDNVILRFSLGGSSAPDTGLGSFFDKDPNSARARD
jgi:hypothetical protein